MEYTSGNSFILGKPLVEIIEARNNKLPKTSGIGLKVNKSEARTKWMQESPF